MRVLRRFGLVLSVSLGALLGMFLSSGVAQAKLVSYGTLGSGTLTDPQGVAIDQASHNVYVGDLNFGVSAEIWGFDSSGNVISPPSPFGTGSGVYTGVAANPTNGELYVHDFNVGSPSLEVYDRSSGASVSSCPVPGSGGEQIASDAAGNVYVPDTPGNQVQELDSACNPVQTFTGSGASALSGPTGVAVDAAGDVWVADAQNNRVEEFGPTGSFIASFASTGVQAVAVNAAGHVFAVLNNSADSCGTLPSPCAHVVEYSTAGAQLDDVGAGTIGTSLAEVFFGVNSTLAVDDASGKVYVSDGANNVVRVFGPPTAPVIGRELAEQVTASGATLGVRINAGGADTSYHFDYGTTTAYGQAAPVPDGDAGSGVQPRTVWGTATGLQAGTTYHYRVLATNSVGTATGPDQTFTTGAGGCPNDRFRIGSAAGLPDCRAYEMVTPSNKDSGAPSGHLVLSEGLPGFQVAGDGSRIAFFSHDSFPGSVAGAGSYLATRGAGGWGSQNLIPPQSVNDGERCSYAVMQLYSADLSRGILGDGAGQGEEGCGTDYPNLVPGEPQGVQNLFLRDNASGGYQLVDVTPQGVAPGNAGLQAGSADLSHVVFEGGDLLTPDALSGGDNLYEWTGGQVRLVSYIPSAPAAECGSGGPACTPTVGVLAGGQINHGVSADGSRIFFTVAENLYVRLNGSRTVQVDASQAGGSGGGGAFQFASVDGSQVFFRDDASAGLTGDTVPGSGNNLYSYNTVTERLADITPQPVVDFISVLGASEDGSYVYFTASGALASGATAGKTNVYLYHAGAITFVATASIFVTVDPFFDLVRVSANGLFIAFTSTDSLTGYDNTDVNTGQPDPEIYLYSTAADQLSCASCDPAGGPPAAGAALLRPQEDAQADLSKFPFVYDPSSVSDTGQVFFDTQAALLPADTNGMRDVYEYEAGNLHLLSTGRTQNDAWFVNATPSGSDVFFVTSQQLLSQDGDTSPDAYDARVNGGFPLPLSPPVPCVGDACRPVSGAAPPAPLAASVSFFGPGNASASTAPGGVKARASGRVRVLTGVVHGSSFLLRVSVPGRGRVTIAGAGIGTVRRSLARAGTFQLGVSLTAGQRRALSRRQTLRLKLRVAYVPAGGRPSAATVVLTDKR